jgi:hypothetical protein
MKAALGPWDPLRPEEVAGALAGCDRSWWIAGGYAIDAFVGKFDRRPHGDVDVGVLARDQHALRACLAGWEAWCAEPPGTLRPWREHETLAEPVHDVWLRPGRREPWRLAFVLNSHVDDTWVYRRDQRVRRPLAELVWWLDGIPYLVPEVQLLFKAKTVRAKDERDFADAVPLLDDAQRQWLRDALQVAHPGHQWLSRL